MVQPTLLVSGSLVPTSDKTTKEELDKYTAIHWILALLDHKWKKKDPNIHDRIFLLKSLVGSGKTTAFIVETFRRFFNTRKYTLNEAKKYREPIDFDFSIFDYPDDQYTIANRKAGTIQPVTKTSHIILCSQPKIILAKGKSIEVSSEDFNPDLELEGNVGYATGSYKSYPTDSSQIIYCTMGTLCQIMKNKTHEEILKKYEMIAVDECHERSLELDEGCAYIRDFLQKNAGNPSCPMFVFMSATFDIKKYADYLDTDYTNSVLVEGGAISRDFIYLTKDTVNVYQETAELAYKIHNDNLSDTDTYNDMLIFAPGEADIKKIVRALEKLDEKKELYITIMTSEVFNGGGPEYTIITKYSLEKLREDTNRPNIKRRVTVSTSVVETGLTVKTLKYVIDTCMAKVTAYSPVHNLSSLITQGCSQSSLEQRGGRAGRIQYGYIYRMLTEDSVAKLDEYSRPDLYTKDLSKVLLDMMYANLEIDQVVKPMSNETFNLFVKDCTDIFNFKLTNKTEDCKCLYNFGTKISKEQSFVNEITLKHYPNIMLDRIPTDAYVFARNKMISLGFYGTYIGYLASKINRMSLESIRMVMAGLVYGVNINDLITIGIFVDTGERRYRYDRSYVQRAKGKEAVTEFRSDRLLESIIKDSTVKKHFAGDREFLKNQLYDEFLEPLFVMRLYARLVRKHGPMGVINEGKKIGINYRTVYKFMDCRKDIQDSFKKVGILNICDEIDFNSDKMKDDIIRIKRCIHAGFKNNLAYLTEDGVRYKTNTGLIIVPKDLMPKFKPKKIVYGRLHMKADGQTKYYVANPTYVCGLDGVI